MTSPNVSKRELYKQLWERDLYNKEIANKYDVSPNTIRRWRKYYGIPNPYGWKPPETTLENLYLGKDKTRDEIADIFDASRYKVDEWLKSYELYKRRRVNSCFYTDSDGYEVIRCKKPEKDEFTLIGHHRLLMTLKYEIDEIDGNHVHHKNENTWDNRLFNLELTSPEDHARHHRLKENEKESESVLAW